MWEQQDQQGCPLHPVLLSSFAFWKILWSTCSNLAQNAVKRDILELDKANAEALLLLQTKAQCDVLKQQGSQVHTQTYIPGQQRSLDI